MRPLYAFKDRYPKEKIAVFPFQQTDQLCFILCNAWLRWFLSSDHADIVSGNFSVTGIQNDLAQPPDYQANADCTYFWYNSELIEKLTKFSLRLHQVVPDISSDLTEATHIEQNNYQNEGGLIFAQYALGPGIAHSMCFAVRRYQHDPNMALFAFFDPNEGMLLMLLDNFPSSTVGYHEEMNVMQDTLQLADNANAHQAGLNKMITFFDNIKYHYNYKIYHCDKVSKRRAALLLPHVFEIRFDQSASSPTSSPVLLSRTLPLDAEMPSNLQPVPTNNSFTV